jgi:ParB-like chromosome segregation protein Spo0J
MSGSLQVVYRPLTTLVPYARNARRHSPTQISKIKASLLEYGWANVMLVADNQMIAGHARLASALELLAEGKPIPFSEDPTLGPTIDLSHLTPTQRRAYILADNRLAEEAVWDNDLLRIEFGELQAVDDFNPSLTGFTQTEIDTVLHGWAPDFARHEGTDANLDPLLTLIRLRCQRTDLDRVMASLREALAGFERITIEPA